MMKATALQPNGRKLLILGLSDRNLDLLREQGLDGAITIDGQAMGLDCDVIITAAATEADLLNHFSKYINEKTDLHIDDGLQQ